MEVVALVKFNDHKAFVVKEKITDFKYKRYGNVIIGIDESETFIKTYVYGYDPYEKAFGGAKFNIQLEDGSVEHCIGHWWDGGSGKASKILGKEIISVTVNDIESLKNCYVFSGMYAIKDKLMKLENTYNGKLYEYYDYKKEIQGR